MTRAATHLRRLTLLSPPLPHRCSSEAGRPQQRWRWDSLFSPSPHPAGDLGAVGAWGGASGQICAVLAEIRRGESARRIRASSGICAMGRDDDGVVACARRSWPAAVSGANGLWFAFPRVGGEGGPRAHARSRPTSSGAPVAGGAWGWPERSARGVGWPSLLAPAAGGARAALSGRLGYPLFIKRAPVAPRKPPLLLSPLLFPAFLFPAQIHP